MTEKSSLKSNEENTEKKDNSETTLDDKKYQNAELKDMQVPNKPSAKDAYFCLDFAIESSLILSEFDYTNDEHK